HCLDHQCSGDDVLDNGDAGEDVVGRRTAFLLELGETLAHCLQRAIGRARLRVVERDVPTGGGRNLSNPAAHLPGPDDEHVCEPHRASLTAMSRDSPWTCLAVGRTDAARRRAASPRRTAVNATTRTPNLMRSASRPRRAAGRRT